MINQKAGHFKYEHIQSLKLYESTTPGTLQGEGSAFFHLSGVRTEHTWCRLCDTRMLYKLEENGLLEELYDFLKENRLAATDIDVIISGASGDSVHAQPLIYIVEKLFMQTVQLRY